MVDTTVSPDDVCLVCEETRENHGDKVHKFSRDGQLLPLDEGPVARQLAPKERRIPGNYGGQGYQAQADLHTAKSLATLLEILVDKELLSAKDIIRIMRGDG